MLVSEKKNQGFSLAEIVVVVGIFSATTLAIFQLVWKNIYVQKHNKDFLAASMLAQEGLELVRNLRDKNWLEEPANPTDPRVSPWKNIEGAANNDFTIDYAFNVKPEVDDVMSEGARLFINGNGFYDHVSSGTSTKFHRLISIDESDIPDKIELKATIKWEDYIWDHLGVRTPIVREYVASTELYDWR